MILKSKQLLSTLLQCLSFYLVLFIFMQFYLFWLFMTGFWVFHYEWRAAMLFQNSLPQFFRGYHRRYAHVTIFLWEFHTNSNLLCYLLVIRCKTVCFNIFVRFSTRYYALPSIFLKKIYINILFKKKLMVIPDNSLEKCQLCACFAENILEDISSYQL